MIFHSVSITWLSMPPTPPEMMATDSIQVNYVIDTKKPVYDETVSLTIDV